MPPGRRPPVRPLMALHGFDGRPLAMPFSLDSIGAPSIDSAPGERQILTFETEGSTAPPLEGDLRVKLQVVHRTPPPPLQPVSATFRLDADVGLLEGTWFGTIYTDPEHNRFVIHARGRVLRVTAELAGLAFAELVVASDVDLVDGRPVREHGTLTLIPYAGHEGAAGRPSHGGAAPDPG